MFIEIRKERNQKQVRHRSGKLINKWFSKTLYIFKCDNCGKEIIRGCSDIANKKRLTGPHKHFCETCFSPGLAAQLGKANYRKFLDAKIGEKQIDSLGYMTVYVANTHPYSTGYCGRQREHILVMENHLERLLKKGEVVHHIDGDKLNNDISNLDVCTVGEHNNCHAKSEEIVFELYKRGVVGYDRESKRYYLKNA